MKVVLFCGGQGLRMRVDGNGNDLPKPMVPIGPRPILWHLMKYYAHFGHKDFILCLGYKGAAIKEFFASYQEWVSNDFVLNGGGARIDLLKRDINDWRITLVDTGLDANIGERLVAVRPFLEGEEMFLANYSDGLTDCPVDAIVQQLVRTEAVGTCMISRPNISLHLVDHAPDGRVRSVLDPDQADLWINAGFFAFRQEIFDYIRPGEELVMEPFNRLIAAGKLAAHRYTGFWRCCDTFKDLQNLNSLQARSPAPWEVWRKPTAPVQAPDVLELSGVAAE
jgi:glucose-1-phosphate cytidylyltransferase